MTFNGACLPQGLQGSPDFPLTVGLGFLQVDYLLPGPQPRVKGIDVSSLNEKP